MTLSDLGDLGDFLGGVAVLATLVYLAIQIRANTRAVRSASLDAVATSHFDSQWSLGRDPGLAKLWFDGLKGDVDLSEADAQRFWMLLISSARRWERDFHKHLSGTLEPEVWAGIEAENAGIFSTPGAQKFWEAMRGAFSTEFVAFVDTATRSKR